MSYQLTAAYVPKVDVKVRTRRPESFSARVLRDARPTAFRISTAYHAEEINGAKQTELSDRVLESLRQEM